MNSLIMQKKQYSTGWIMSLCAAFIIYKYILQVFPSTMSGSLMREFQMNGLNAGHLSAVFLYTLVITQLFVGYWLDRYNPLRLTFFAIILCSIGIFCFSYVNNLYTAMIARALMGIGGAFAAASYFKIASLLIDARRFAFVSGLLATSVTTGIILGQIPLAWLNHYYHWRTIAASCGIIGFLLAFTFFILMYGLIKNDSAKIKQEEISQRVNVTKYDILAILRNPQNWLLTFYNGLVFSPVGTFSGLWGISFLTQGCQIEPIKATLLSACVFTGFGIGSPVIGLLSDIYGKLKFFMLTSTCIAFLILNLIIYNPYWPFSVTACLLFMLGFSSGALMLGFVLGNRLNDSKATATLTTLLNTGGVAITALTEPLIGQLLDWKWRGEWVEGVRYFSLSSYQIALTILPVYLFIAFILLIFLKEMNLPKKID